MRADIHFAKAKENRPAPLGMTILRELAKAVLDENVVATQTPEGLSYSGRIFLAPADFAYSELPPTRIQPWGATSCLTDEPSPG
jgi:hypothetical protein